MRDVVKALAGFKSIPRREESRYEWAGSQLLREKPQPEINRALAKVLLDSLPDAKLQEVVQQLTSLLLNSRQHPHLPTTQPSDDGEYLPLDTGRVHGARSLRRALRKNSAKRTDVAEEVPVWQLLEFE